MEKRKVGFTLIELLVVIAIIAILAAILFPVFTAAKAKAQQVACMNNMKQLSIGVLRYADDHQGAFPQCCDSYSWTWGTWRERVQPYVKSKAILRCSSKTKQLGNVPDPYSHYGLATGITHPDLARPGFITTTGSWGYGFTYLHKLQQPSRTFMIAENKESDWSVEPMTDYSPHWYSGPGGPGTFYPYHLRSNGTTSDYNGGGNFIFCDGHVKFMLVNACESYDAATNKRYFYYWIGDKGYILPPLNR